MRKTGTSYRSRRESESVRNKKQEVDIHAWNTSEATEESGVKIDYCAVGVHDKLKDRGDQVLRVSKSLQGPQDGIQADKRKKRGKVGQYGVSADLTTESGALTKNICFFS